MGEQPWADILVVDIGPQQTHGALLGRVEGVHRLLGSASTPTVGQPEADLAASLRSSLRRLEEEVGRSLLGPDDAPLVPRQGHRGADALVVTTSAAPPLECAVVGLSEELSLKGGIAACCAAGGSVAGRVALTQGQVPRQRAFLAVRDASPDVIVLVGGVDAGPTRPLLEAARQLAAVYADVEPSDRPAIVFAGNQEARRPIAQILGSSFDYRVVDNVTPRLHDARPQELQRELALLYATRRLPRLAGYATVAGWASSPPLPSLTGLATVLQYLGRAGGEARRVLGLELGAERTMAALADDGYLWSTQPTGGLPVRSAAALALGALSQTTGEPHDHGLAVDLIAARGDALAAMASPAETALALLDAVQPVGVTRIVLDWASLWPQLGALARLEPVAALQVLERDALLELATTLSLPGHGRRERPAAHLRLEGGSDATQLTARWGHVLRVELAEGALVTLALTPARGSRLERSRITARGGSLGLVVDARGRPVPLPREVHGRRALEQVWLQELA